MAFNVLGTYLRFHVRFTFRRLHTRSLRWTLLHLSHSRQIA